MARLSYTTGAQSPPKRWKNNESNRKQQELSSALLFSTATCTAYSTMTHYVAMNILTQPLVKISLILIFLLVMLQAFSKFYVEVFRNKCLMQSNIWSMQINIVGFDSITTVRQAASPTKLQHSVVALQNSGCKTHILAVP